jgi:hypothetical protein
VTAEVGPILIWPASGVSMAGASTAGASVEASTSRARTPVTERTAIDCQAPRAIPWSLPRHHLRTKAPGDRRLRFEIPRHLLFLSTFDESLPPAVARPAPPGIERPWNRVLAPELIQRSMRWHVPDFSLVVATRGTPLSDRRSPHRGYASISSTTPLIISDRDANCHRLARAQYGKLGRFTYPQKSKPIAKVRRIPHWRSVNFSHRVT